MIGKTVEIDEAGDGRAGLKAILQNSYDVVLCDIKMPKIDGVEVLVLSLQDKVTIIILVSKNKATSLLNIYFLILTKLVR